MGQRGRGAPLGERIADVHAAAAGASWRVAHTRHTDVARRCKQLRPPRAVRVLTGVLPASARSGPRHIRQ
eukprot:12889892-Prorocentrum_lima.AAC.1